ncbi:hypothetical protein EV702DRAFT_784350 [Suillus placidus]|uniref:Uncharacterized protein n=1 Tax=Suillus placidus TaxID=48579 RepID=A0A9P6ZHS9_9AGAM|nr:hypothetical protein EV702DRAFT_784350 [Suillus placidus]
MYFALYWTTWVLIGILGVIMIARLHAMYQRSRKVLVLLLVVFMAINVSNTVMLTINMRYISAEQVILSGTYQCVVTGDGPGHLGAIPWILAAVWEIFTLCLAVRVCIALKHLHELRQQSAGSIIGDCFTVLITTHTSYCVSFVVVVCFLLGYLSPLMPKDPYSAENLFYFGFLQTFLIVQSAVLGPRLILGVREYHAKLVMDSDAGPGMASIAFQERVHVSTSNSV